MNVQSTDVKPLILLWAVAKQFYWPLFSPMNPYDRKRVCVPFIFTSQEPTTRLAQALTM